MRFTKTACAAFTLLIGLLMLIQPALAQQTSGSISGIVQDSQGSVVPGARVILTNQAQGAVVREISSSTEGSFMFTPLPPGTYSVAVEAPGFKRYLQQEIILNAQARVGLPPIVLEIGAIGETITVEASAVTLQTVSAERSGVITTSQILDLALSGRNFTDLMKTVAGVNADSQSVNGGRSDQNNYTLDGVSTIDTGCNCQYYRFNTDTLAEVKVLTNGQQAEFGRAAGANVTVVTKSGTQDFHGGAYWFLRNESLNANTWMNNYYGRPRNMYRYRTQGVTIGGPIYIPGKFNSDRNKLFFFANFEWQRPRTPDAWTNLNLPTLAERNGDFSLTQEKDGSFVTIKDPASNGAPFPGNQIPKSRFNTYGLQILNLLPVPNMVDADNDPTFNHQYSFPSTRKMNDQTFRIDYNISDSWKFYFRFVRNSTIATQSGGLNAVNNLGLSPFDSQTGSIFGLGNLTTIINPTLTNEFVYGNSRGFLPNKVPADSKYLRSVSNVTLPMLFPNADPTGIVPNLSFGDDVANAPSISFMGLPYDNENPVVNFTDNIAKVFPKHMVKAGIFVEITRKRQTASAPNNGALSFARDSRNPGDTNWAFSNLLLGSFQSFDQADNFLKGYYYYRNIEWYIQDNWKVLPNLTLDYGLRFSVIDPMYEEKNKIANFDPSLFNPSKQVILFQPALDAGGQRASLNPATGEIGPAVLIGSIVPGIGDVDNGMAVAGRDGYPKGLIENRGVHYGPRFGLAWAPGGVTSKTVIRTGGGVFFERIQGNMIFNQILYPPILRLPRIYYGNLSTIASSSQSAFPVTAAGVARDGKLPTVYNYSFGVQRELPFAFLMDVSYVGSISRHLTSRRPFNEPAFGSAWLPEFQDPTYAVPKYDGTTTLPVDFTRPYIGYAGYGTAAGGNHPGGGGFITTFGSSANYNSLQFSLNRRMSEGLQFGFAYTWAKALGTQSALNEAQHPTDTRKADYGPLTFDRRHNLVFNYIYNLPNPIPANSFLDNAVARGILSGWQLSGITTFMSGSPTNVTYSRQGTGGAALNREITGSEPQAPRVVMTGNPNLSGGDRSLAGYVETSVFRPAAKGSHGMDSGRGVITGPGINNWDISLFKKIPLGSDEERYIQLRLETYNTFNHTQWSGFNTTVQFDRNGTITNLPTELGGGGGRFGFGALNAARNPRIIQLAAKFYF